MIKRANLFMLMLIIYVQAQSVVIAYFVFFLENYGIHRSMMVLQDASLILSFGVPFVVYALVAKERLPQMLPLKRLDRVNLLLVVAMSISVIPLMMAVSAASAALFDNHAADFLHEMAMLPVLPVLVSIAVLPAVLEEFVFRGLILTNLKNLGIKKAALVSGLFFGFIHLDLQQMPYAFIMGVIFAYMVHYTQSIYASVLSHFILNASMVLLSYAAAGMDPDTEFPLLQAVLIAAPIFIAAFRYFISYNKRYVTEETAVGGELKHTPFTWEFWALVCVYAASVLFLYR